MNEKYKLDPDVCPFCGSTNIYPEEREIVDGLVHEYSDCETCKKEWTDVYKLVDRLEES